VFRPVQLFVIYNRRPAARIATSSSELADTKKI